MSELKCKRAFGKLYFWHKAEMHLRPLCVRSWCGSSNIQKEKSQEHQQYIRKRQRQFRLKTKPSTSHGPGGCLQHGPVIFLKGGSQNIAFGFLCNPCWGGGGGGAHKGSLLQRAMTFPDVLRAHSCCFVSFGL